MFEQIKRWLMQPTTIHGLAALAAAAMAKVGTGAPPWVIYSGIIAGLVMMIVPDNSAAAKPIEKLAADAIQAAVQGKLKEMAPALFGDAVQVGEAFTKATPIAAAATPAPLVAQPQPGPSAPA